MPREPYTLTDPARLRPPSPPGAAGAGAAGLRTAVVGRPPSRGGVDPRAHRGLSPSATAVPAGPARWLTDQGASLPPLPSRRHGLQRPSRSPSPSRPTCPRRDLTPNALNQLIAARRLCATRHDGAHDPGTCGHRRRPRDRTRHRREAPVRRRRRRAPRTGCGRDEMGGRALGRFAGRGGHRQRRRPDHGRAGR